MRKADAATPGEWARGQLMVVGLSYHTTSLEQRAQLAPISEQRGTAQKPMPGVLLATCNRIELYSWVTGRRGRSAAIGARASQKQRAHGRETPAPREEGRKS